MDDWTKPGAALRDDESEEAAAPPEQSEAPESPTDGAHLCLGCIHAGVCGIASAITFAGGEGSVTISRCGAFRPEVEAAPGGASGDV